VTPASTFVDDNAISDSDSLYRRIKPQFLVPGEDGRLRVASAAFKSYEMSVLIDSLLSQQRRAIEQVMQNYPGKAAVAFTVGLARELGQIVCKDIEPPNDPAHGLVIGKKTGSIANRPPNS
jgi:hypothetical protein